MDSSTEIIVNKKDHILWVTLNRPAQRNALNATMLTRLSQIICEIRSDSSIKCMVLTGGEVFCIGSDLKFLANAFNAKDLKEFRDYLERINNFIFGLEELPIPVVAMVNGKARAAGFEIMLGCDFIVVADDAKIGDVHTPFGHIPGGVSQRLARKIGVQRAMEIIMTGRWLTGVEAQQYGIAILSSPSQDLQFVTTEFIKNFTDKSRDCLSFAKRNIIQGLNMNLRDAVKFEMHNYLEFLSTSSEPVDTFNHNQNRRQLEKDKLSK